MQLNEVIEENSLATISKRTRISVENIEKLVNRDFSGMKRVKALGFISILEREFGIETDSLKTECIGYFSPYPDEEFDAKLVVTIPEAHETRGGQFSKFFMLLLLIAIGYGAWYFMSNNRIGTADSNSTTVTSTSFVGSIVDQAKAWLGNSSSLDENPASSAPNSTGGVWAKSDNAEAATPLKENPTDTEKQKDEQNDSAVEEQIIKQVKEEQQEIIAQGKEADNADILTIEGLLEEGNTDINNADDIPAVSGDDALAVEVPSMADQTNADEIVAVKETKEDAKKKVKEKRSKNKSLVVLHPTKKIWVGYTDLTTMKRAARVIEEDIDFDTTESSWILVAGHNAFNFIIKGKTITPKKREKNYFLIEKGKAKAISQEEFQKLNKSKVW